MACKTSRELEKNRAWEAKKEIVISGAYIGGATAQGVIQFNNDDSAEMHLRLTATDGTVLLDLKARSEQLR